MMMRFLIVFTLFFFSPISSSVLYAYLSENTQFYSLVERSHADNCIYSNSPISDLNLRVLEDIQSIGFLSLIEKDGETVLSLCMERPENEITMEESVLLESLDSAYFTILTQGDSKRFAFKDSDGIDFDTASKTTFSVGVSVVHEEQPYSISLNIEVQDVNNNLPPEIISPRPLSAGNTFIANAIEGTPYSLFVLARDTDAPEGYSARNVTYLMDDGEHMDLFDIDAETGQVTQKEDTFLTQEESPYSIKITPVEESIGIITFSDGTELEDYAATNALWIEIHVVQQSISTPAPTIVSSATPAPVSGSSKSSGGKDDTIVQNLSGDILHAAPAEEVLVCPKEKYNRFSENRGNGVSSSLFQDVSSGHRAYTALIDLAEQEIVNGDTGTGNARLDDSISRAEFVKIMTIAREDTLLLGDCLKFSNFTDVPEEAWFTPFVQNLEQKAIVKGYTDNKYRPGQSINLVEAYKIIALSFDYITLDEAHQIVHDQNIQWYVPYIHALEEAGVIPLWMRDYEMNAEISRGDMFALLSNVLRQVDWNASLGW